MDTPKSCKPTATSTAEAVPAQDSPVFNFISNLSPIQPVKPPPVTQGFPGLNSPPLVFTSPRLNARSKLTSIRRPQFPGLSSAKLSEQNNISGNSLTPIVAYENQDVKLSARVATCDEKGSFSHASADNLAESPEECTDQFFSDVVDADCVHPNTLADSSRKKSENFGQSQEPIESNVECKYTDKARTIDEIDVADPAIAKQIKGKLQGNTPSNMSVVATNIKQGSAISVDPHPMIESELPLDHTLTDQVHDSRTESQEVSQADPMNQSSKLPLESVQIGKDDEISVECTDVLSKSVLKDMQNVEAFQHRGIRRRCLQFEDALQKAISNQPVQSPSDGGCPTVLSREAPLLPSNRKQVKTVQSSYPGNINSGKNIPKRSGIGLHLNSIVTSVHAGSESVVCVKSAQMVNLSVRGTKSIPLTNSPLGDTSNNSPTLYSTENASASTGEKIHEIHPTVAVYSAASTLKVKSSNNSIICNPLEDQSASGNKRKYNNDETDACSEEFGPSPKRKRKKPDINDGDGCKRCNCKKSRCLKLYCDCFAAGIYCAGPCACQECYNRPEYEDTVLETRRHIESRNPLAFAPRVVVQPVTEAPASNCGESGTNFTPSSARHKRGCNCKKSMCLKKYCECYQAKVGCSDGCRCEGCKNIYGQKGDYGLCSQGAHARIEGSLIEKVVVSGKGLCHNEVTNPHNSTPLTPAVQSLIHGKDGSESCPLSGKNFQSPESDLSFVAQYLISPESCRNPDNKDTSSEIAQESMDEIQMISNQHGLSGSLAVLNPKEWANISKARSVSGSKNCSSSSSLCWRGAPNTPVVQSSGANPHQLIELDDIMLDDTPDILRDNPIPITAVKSSSPNKKRVSPPHAWRKQLTSSSSANVRTGRKFILKAVPSFPPLTPCVDSKSTESQQINDPHK